MGKVAGAAGFGIVAAAEPSCDQGLVAGVGKTS
jgi:hypothetical protein